MSENYQKIIRWLKNEGEKERMNYKNKRYFFKIPIK